MQVMHIRLLPINLTTVIWCNKVMKHYLYIIVIALVFLAFTVVFDTFPRSTVSELEKRELATFPEFSWERLADGSFTSDISTWFSDSEPYRDVFMTLSMQIKDLIAIAPSEDNIKFQAGDMELEQAGGTDSQHPTANGQEPKDSMTIDDYENHINADENAKIANAGIIIVGKGDKVRALMAYGGGPKGCVGYAQAANKYKEVFGSKVNIYCMVIPTAVEFYCPDKAKKRTNRQLPTIRNVVAHLDPGVKPVDVYTTLGKHADEDIYLRTDHHWSPLGGYYAAQEFARVAGVPFKDLSHYERRVTHGYVGSMYGYSKDISIKNAPEDFVYYVPKGVEYTTTYTNYTINKNYQVTGEGKPYKAAFFFKFKDGHGGAYCTMMGGDTKLTQVRTSTHNGRRVIILKDSFGNMLPGYLFFSFEEVHVIDSRYFTKDIIAYVEENKITDILFANNIFKAYSSHTYGSYLRFLHQQWHRPGADPAKAKGDSAVKHKEHQPEAPKPEKEPSEPVKSTEPVVESKEMAEPTVKERATNQTGSQQ